jgi:hypothetical protein
MRSFEFLHYRSDINNDLKSTTFIAVTYYEYSLYNWCVFFFFFSYKAPNKALCIVNDNNVWETNRLALETTNAFPHSHVSVSCLLQIHDSIFLGTQALTIFDIRSFHICFLRRFTEKSLDLCRTYKWSTQQHDSTFDCNCRGNGGFFL